eukprot:4563610-Pleurochrysis_carterae.AAC.1
MLRRKGWKKGDEQMKGKCAQQRRKQVVRHQLESWRAVPIPGPARTHICAERVAGRIDLAILVHPRVAAVALREQHARPSARS